MVSGERHANAESKKTVRKVAEVHLTELLATAIVGELLKKPSEVRVGAV
jgi:hypothetical protein